MSARPDLAALLADPARVAGLPAAELPALALRLAALQSAVAARLHQIVGEHDGDDCEAFDVEEAARRLRVSVDTLREHGEAWGVALVVTRDRQGRATRVIYPRALLRAFLSRKPTPTKRSAA